MAGKKINMDAFVQRMMKLEKEKEEMRKKIRSGALKISGDWGVTNISDRH
tara:strand:+ start:1573 stop:1722 length:150 start_codon:yes stop_codon:yes gene_type:complete